MTPESTCTSSVVDSLPSMITYCVRQDIGNSRSNWGYDLFLFHRTPVSVGVSWGVVCRMHWRSQSRRTIILIYVPWLPYFWRAQGYSNDDRVGSTRSPYGTRKNSVFVCIFKGILDILPFIDFSCTFFFQECVFFIFFKSSKRDGNRDNIEQTLPEISHKLSAHNQYTVYIHTVADWVSSWHRHLTLCIFFS